MILGGFRREGSVWGDRLCVCGGGQAVWIGPAGSHLLSSQSRGFLVSLGLMQRI